MRSKSVGFGNLLVYAAGALLVLVRILQKTHFHFTYSLDDPYIHLALADRIRHGFYGLNQGEAASPSSSLLWPLLLVPFAGSRFFQYVPLCLNLLFGGATAWLLGRFVEEAQSYRKGDAVLWQSRLLAALLLFATNLFGLVFTGLEHSLEMLLCVLCAWCVLRLVWADNVSDVLLIAVALLPSVRYEGVLPVVAVAFALWATGRRTRAAGLVVGSLAPLAAFALFLRHLHLPAIPMSVLVKASSASSTQHLGHTLRTNLVATLLEPERHATAMLLLALFALSWQFWQWRRARFALLGASLFLFVQIVLGPFGWFFRYEMYAVGFALPIAIAGFLAQPYMPWAEGSPERSSGNATISWAGWRQPGIPPLLLLAVAAVALSYAVPFLETPSAAASIYGQQGQMARFASDFYKGPVAVNDLGMVVMHREPQQYVLDLAGLGSYEVFRTRPADRTTEWLEDITMRHRIELVMIYPEWFGTLPATWHPAAVLCLDTLSFGPQSRRVVFYATPLANTSLLATQLERFSDTLPPGTSFELVEENSPLTCSA